MSPKWPILAFASVQLYLPLIPRVYGLNESALVESVHVLNSLPNLMVLTNVLSLGAFTLHDGYLSNNKRLSRLDRDRGLG